MIDGKKKKISNVNSNIWCEMFWSAIFLERHFQSRFVIHERASIIKENNAKQRFKWRQASSNYEKTGYQTHIMPRRHEKCISPKCNDWMPF